ncbi:MAG: hypothetical protein GX927_07565 [Lentisphaerae bacterium]|jgi:hypothetical protein|nr:hypothetical protein [Lentisphaerota bacterium]
MLDEYCMYPDRFFTNDRGTYEALLPYIFIDEGIQFHYPPNTPLSELYRYWLPDPDKGRLFKPRPFQNLNFIHVSKGFEFYLTRIIYHFRRGDWCEGAKYAGCLLHMLEDSCFGVHALEGPGGSDIFILERLFGTPEDNLGESPLAILSAIDCSAAKPEDYAPRPLGESIPEIIMRLYAEYVGAVDRSRRLCFNIVENVRQNRRQQNTELVRQMAHNTIRLCADVLFSAWSLAVNAPDLANVPQNIPLTCLEPHVFPLGGAGGYRFLSYLKNFAVNAQMQKLPLQLRLEDGILTYESGLSWGSHFEAELLYWLPENTFCAFEAAIGLHPDSISPTSKVIMQIINNGAILEEMQFSAQVPARRLSISAPCGDFGFRVSYPLGVPHQSLILVVGNPMLKKAKCPC